MPFLKDLGQVAVTLETSEGTEAQAVAADAFMVIDPAHKVGVDFKTSDAVRSSLSSSPGIASSRNGPLTFKTPFKGSGTLALPPEIDQALKAAAFAEIIEAGQAVFYDSAASSNPSATVTVWINETAASGKKYTFRGCRIKWSFSWELGEIMYIDWEVTSADWTVLDVTPLAGTFQDSDLLVFKGVTLSLGGFEGCIKSFSLDSGAVVTNRQCIGSAVTPVLFTGAGLDDGSFSGVFDGDHRTSFRYRAEIDGTGTPDTFRWSRDGGATWAVSTVSITGAAQLLENGLYVTFAATTGHTIGDRWDVSIANSGSISAIITSFPATGVLVVEEQLLAAANFEGYMRNATSLILSLSITTSAGNNVALYAQEVQITDISSSESDGILYADLTLQFNLNTKTTAAAITAFADAGGGKVTVTSAAHGLGNGAHVTIAGTTNYNGDFKVENVTTDTYDIVDTWVADDATGTWVCANGFCNLIFT